MKHILKDFLKTAQTQLFGKQEETPQSGKLELTSNAARKILAWGLDTETLKLTFEIGRGNGGKIKTAGRLPAPISITQSACGMWRNGNQSREPKMLRKYVG